MSTKILAVEAIREQAARWIVLLNEGELSDAERESLHEWLASDPRHAAEYQAHAVVGALAAQLASDPELAGIHQEDAASGSTIGAPRGLTLGAPNRIWLGGLAVAATVVVSLTAWFVFIKDTLSPEIHSTGTGQMHTVTFEDGSVAYLNTRTRLYWDGKDNDRKVVLEEGEALFNVSPDAARPFRVVVDSSEIRVLGTRFNVYRRNNGDVRVTVVDGKVEVRQQDQGSISAWTQTLSGNQQIAYSSIGLVHEVRTVNASNIVKWREGVLELTNEPLPSVLDELTRYTDQRIVIHDPQLAQLRLGGALSTRDVRAALARIEKLAPIAVTENGNTFTLNHRSNVREERR